MVGWEHRIRFSDTLTRTRLWFSRSRGRITASLTHTTRMAALPSTHEAAAHAANEVRPCGATHFRHRRGVNRTAVPHILHQTWKTCSPLPAQNAMRSSCVALHPSWDLVLWDDDANRRLIVEEYPSYLGLYDALNTSIQQADAARLFYLHRWGGVYMDLDFMCLRPLPRAVHGRNNAFYVGSQHDPKNKRQPKNWRYGAAATEHVANAFMAAPPRHAFADYLLQRLRKARLPKQWSLGPLFLTAAVIAYQKEARAIDAPVVVLDFCTIYGVQWNERHPCQVKAHNQLTGENECRSKLPSAVTTSLWLGTWLASRPRKHPPAGTCIHANETSAGLQTEGMGIRH